ncbi:hypothetical protein NDU88_004675 [Pleurodeles waltl]|uniref:Secreted protein n=1 Tax=Pleurodeles waltl TaxID=8319 RepID=A0AAV7VGW6_PLEWA|nr:hypothetical protein NDU88_004675 [Pleurodeles waltl]
MMSMSSVVAQSEYVAAQVAVVAAVSAAGTLAVVHVSAPVEGDTRTSPAASDGCPLGMMLRTGAEAAYVQVGVVAVQVAVVAPVSTVEQVAVLTSEGVSPVPHPEAPCPELTSL